MFSNAKSTKASASQKSHDSRHAVSSSDSDATIDPGSDAATEPDTDVTIKPDSQDFDSSKDLFSDPSDDERTPVNMATKIARQATHVISDSGSDSETEIRSSNKDHRNSHKSSLSSSSSSKRLDSKKVSSGHDRNGSAHSSHHVKSHSHSSSSTNGSSNHSNHRAKGYSQHSSSSKVNSDALQKTEKRSKSDLSSSNGSSLFSDVLHLSNSDQTPAKLSSRTVTSEKVATPKTVSNAKPKSITPPTPKTTSGAKKSSKLRDIFGSDSEDSDEDASPPNAKLDPNELVPQPTSPSPPPMSSPSPPPSPSPAPSPSSSPAPSPSPVVLPTQAPETSLSFEQAINFDNMPVNKIAKVKSSSSSKMPSSSFTKSSTNSASKTESRKSEHWSAKSSSPSVTPTSKKEPGKDVTNRDLSTGNDNKRKHISNSNNSNKSKPQCKYGSECTRKNPLHWAEYEHFDESFEQSPLPKKMKSSDGLTTDEKLIKKKYEQAQPFSFFLTQVKGIDDKYNSSFAFDISEILSPAFGNLQASCQFNYMIDISWLVQQYSLEFRKKPLLIVHGFTGAEQKGLQQDAAKFSHVSLCQARLDIPYGTHHSKMMFLLYDSGMKVVIHTANLIPGDWHQKTQAMWISPLFPKLKCGANKNEGHSPTSFKKDLHQYVTAYRNSALSEWERHILAHDMSAAKVSLIASVPGRHTMLQKNAWGHFKLRKVLIDNGPEKMEVDSWPLIGQFSSIGSLGPSPDKWLCSEFYQSLAACRSSACSTPQHKNLKLIYPTVDNVRVSLEGYPAGTCLPYSINTASKQSYLVGFMHRWRSEGRGRTRACPHIKTYMRTSPDFSMAAWFMVTSANLSKAAWGVLEKNGSQLMIRSYEIGVMFLPNLFDVRRLKLTSDIKEASNTDKTMFLLPYDLPPIRYNVNDSPWIYDIPYKELPDTNGMSWCPSRL